VRQNIALCVLLVCFPLLATEAESRSVPNRIEKYAAYRAHKILPESLRYLVNKHGKDLFAGLDRGLRVPQDRITESLIFHETNRITRMVNDRATFATVVRQMGFVAGLVAVYTNPTRESNTVVKRGFVFYANKKLPRCHFVFDGYAELSQTERWLRSELARIPNRRNDHRRLLEDGYRGEGNDPYHLFDERHAVFGVSSLYFSNLARYSAHLWYYAWGSANGDLTRMPFKEDTLGR